MADIKRFQSIYWRQFTLIAGMVLLTLLLLGTSFFALTYTYIMTEKKNEMVEKAELMAELSATYADDFPGFGYRGDEREGIRIMAQVASSLWYSPSTVPLTHSTALILRSSILPDTFTPK